MAKVRSLVALTLAMLAVAGADADAASARSVVVAVLPYGTTVEQIGAVPGFAPGIVSAGLGSVPTIQTYLDIGQGNRVNEALYDGELPPVSIDDGAVPPALWDAVVGRAEGAPADVVPGLLASTLKGADVAVRAEDGVGLAALIAVDREGEVEVVRPRGCAAGCGEGFSVVEARADELAGLRKSLATNDLLIAIASGARGEQTLLPIGIAGPGFDGNLSSSSTHTDGLVTSTDIAPTILEAVEVEVPDEVNGSEITSTSERDPGEVADLKEQLEERPSRESVVLVPFLIWLALAALAALIWRRRGALVALRILGIAVAIAPLTLLVGAAFNAGTLVSALIFGVGSIAAAVLVGRLVPGPGAFALAAAVTVGAYAIDVVAGSPLTALSVLGPNPGYGVRFFGIGNELEAILTTLTLIGTGAALATRPALSRSATAASFLIVAALAAAAFAPGRFGADVGAAIVLAVGAASAAALALGLDRWRAILAVVGAGIVGLAALLAVDQLFGGAHLSESVLGAGEASDVIDVLERRIRLMADTFTDPVYPELLALTAAVLLVGFVCRRAVLGWFGADDRLRPARCGFVGAVAGVLVGTVANDSGSVLFVLGTICLAVSAGFFWASGGQEAGGSGRAAGG